jgi:putative N-acetyltransferase (TIGR04045 family)
VKTKEVGIYLPQGKPVHVQMHKNIICRIAETEGELEEAYRIRHEIFVREQKLFKHTDRDSCDKQAVHIVALINDELVGTVRVYEKDKGTWYGGRLAVKKGFRGRVGAPLVKKAVETVKERKAKRFLAYIQLPSVSFFKRNRWKAVGEVTAYHGVPHQLMEAEL